MPPQPFDDADDEDMDANGMRPRDPFKPSLMAVPLHILRLRRIASKMTRLVYGNRLATPAGRVPEAEGEAVVQGLHRELIEWRRAMPFPLPDTHPQVPHLSSGWFDLNYHTHLALLYRPSPLLPRPSSARVATLAGAAAGALRQAAALHRQRRFAYNWLNLLAVYTAALALVYATTARPDSLPAALAASRAIDDLRLAVELFDTLAAKFAVARKTKRMVEDILARYEYLRDSATQT